MKILIAEDDDEKLEHTREFVLEIVQGANVRVAKSLQSALQTLFAEDFDFIILDMTMPNFDRSIREEGGRPHAFAGREILRQMRRRRISTPAVVLTHFDRFGEESDYMTLGELKDELRENFPNYVDTVQLRVNVDEWKAKLREIILRHAGSD